MNGQTSGGSDPKGSLMAGKRGLVMGVANNRSIAWGIAKAVAAQGAQLALTYQGEALKKRVLPLAGDLGAKLVLPCDVADSASIDAVFATLGQEWGGLDFLVHAIAFSDKNELDGRYVDTSEKNFTQTMLISCYSFTALAQRAEKLMPNGGSLVTLTTGVLGTFQISANIIASERKQMIRTIAAPRVTTQNNTTAEVVNGVQIPVQTVSNNTITTTFVDAALKLQITPQVIVEDGAILLTVIAENNSVSALRTIGGTPGIDEQSARGIVLVPDGGTTVLGGINIDQEAQAEDRTPGLARIPIFGNLFKRRTTNRDTQEILFFITPRIFRPELVGLTQESTLRASDITITPVIQGLENAPAVGGALRFDNPGAGGSNEGPASGSPVP